MDHDAENEKRFVRRTWTPQAKDRPRNACPAGIDNPPPTGSRGDPTGPPSVGSGEGSGCHFVENPECSCWRCAVERICKTFETREHLEEVLPHHLPFEVYEEGELRTAFAEGSVQELDAEIEALQDMDAEDRARALLGLPWEPWV